MQKTRFISKIIVAMLSVTLIFVAAQEADADSTCLIAKNSESYIGSDVKIHRSIIVGIHGSGVFNDKCMESPFPIEIDPGSDASEVFFNVTKYNPEKNKSPAVNVYGNLRRRGRSFYIYVEKIELAN